MSVFLTALGAMGPAAGRCGKGVAASRTCCGKALLVLGPICMGLGVLAAMMVNKEYPKRIRDFAVVSGNS